MIRLPMASLTPNVITILLGWLGVTEMVEEGESVFCYYDRSITLSMILIYSAISNYCAFMLLSAASDSGF